MKFMQYSAAAVAPSVAYLKVKTAQCPHPVEAVRAFQEQVRDEIEQAIAPIVRICLVADVGGKRSFKDTMGQLYPKQHHALAS